MKFSIPGSPFHQICTVYDPESRQDKCLGIRNGQQTRFNHRYNVCDVGHKYATLQLKLYSFI